MSFNIGVSTSMANHYGWILFTPLNPLSAVYSQFFSGMSLLFKPFQIASTLYEQFFYLFIYSSKSSVFVLPAPRPIPCKVESIIISRFALFINFILSASES